ncbi:TldD/PmbA family protein [Candidatus Hodarchaeum mangrovi]
MEFDNLNSELLSTVDSALKYAHGLDSKVAYEIYLFYAHKSGVDITQGVVESSDGIIAGNAIRVVGGVKEKKISFSSSSGVDLERIKANIKEALAFNDVLKITDSRFQSFPDPIPGGVEGILSNDIIISSAVDLLPMSQQVIDEAKQVDERIKMTGFSMGIFWGGFAVGNSNGVQRASRITSSGASFYCQAVEGDDRKDAYEYAISREKIPEIQGFGEIAARKAVKLLNGKILNETTSLPTVWDNMASACFILAGIGAGSNGSNIVVGLSPLADRIGDQVAVTDFTLLDDGQNPTGAYTHAIDAEGIPQQKTNIVENGVLKSFLFNHYYAKIFGTNSTGNCTRGGGIFPSSLPYEESPAVVATNFLVEPKKFSEEELISQIDRGVYIKEMPMGIFHSNVSTGEFSAVANAAFLIENGELKTPLKAVSVAGSFYTGLKSIRQIGGNLKVTPFGVETPSLVIDGLSLVI